MARIFVIDDDEQLLRMVGLMLERGGHNITLIDKPSDGLEQLIAEKPDLLVLDVMMPSISGHDLTRQIRETPELNSLPILILTARSQEIDRDTALRSGADGYLSKPVTSQELIKEIDKLLVKKPMPVESEQGAVLAFYGLRGGVGQTTLATNLALALRQISQQEVCLVDLSPSISQAAIQLHLQPTNSWEDLISIGALDWETFPEYLTIHSSGMRLLAAPRNPVDASTLPADITEKLIRLLSSKMMFTVLDLPPVFSPSFVTALRMANICLHVISPDAVSIRAAVQVNRALANLGIKLKRKSFILNEASAKSQLPKETVERVLNGRIPFHISYDQNQASALTQGAPLVLASTDSPLPTVINRMADVIWKRMSAKKQSAPLGSAPLGSAPLG